MKAILELIGNTPMVRIFHTNFVEKKVEIYGKLEKYNPGGSVKDRIAKYMIEYAEKEGLLTKDKIVIEPTSGNTGIGLALVCAVKDYRLELVMPDTVTEERKKILIAHGAKIILSDGTKGMDGAQDLAKEIVNKYPDKYFMPDQFSNKYNVLAHYETTGEEVWRDTDGRVTHFVAGIGTTGTLMGVSKKLKERNPDIKIIGVEPYCDTPIPGLKNLEIQYIPKIWDSTRVDEKVTVTLEEAEEAARLLSLGEGIFCGPSSGAVVHAALKKAKEIDEGIIVGLLADGGERYMSTELCDYTKCLECIKRYNIVCAYKDET